MENWGVYEILIALSMLILLSYFFNLLARKTNIPSVLMLIITGFAIKQFINIDADQLKSPLEILGNVGLIMIVLEASLDLHITRDKAGLIFKAFLAALVLLVTTSLGIAWIIHLYFQASFLSALIYAIPLSIMSSAIIIPSVGNLAELKKEFLIFEASFSDILGIMFFYFVLDSANINGASQMVYHVSGNIAITLVIAVILSYVLIILFQRVEADVKLFSPIAALGLLYGVGKLFHLSSLIFILAFGLIINNREIFFRWKFAKLIVVEKFDDLLADIKMLTLESSFIIRTFFFVVFGMSISLAGIADIHVFVVSLLALAVIFGLRFLMLTPLLKKDKFPAIAVAPRGLITILLYFAIPETQTIQNFRPSILLMLIIISSGVMMYGLIKSKRSEVVEDLDKELSSLAEHDESAQDQIEHENTPTSSVEPGASHPD